MPTIKCLAFALLLSSGCSKAPVTNSRTVEAGATGATGSTGSTTSTGVAFQRTIVVSPVANDDVASGNALRAALNSISDGAADKHYLVWAEPGTYDLGSDAGFAPIALPPHVDLHGSGEGATVITATNATGAILTMNTDCTLRDLTLRASGNTNYRGITTINVGPRRISNVTLDLQSGASYGIDDQSGEPLTVEESTLNVRNVGAVTGIQSYGALDARDLDITILGETADATGITCWAFAGDRSVTVRQTRISMLSLATEDRLIRAVVSSINGHTNMTTFLDDVDITVSGRVPYAVWQTGGSLTLTDSTVRTSGAVRRSVLINQGVARVANTLLDGIALVQNGGTFACFGDFNADLTALDAGCQ